MKNNKKQTESEILSKRVNKGLDHAGVFIGTIGLLFFGFIALVILIVIFA